jgi:membrane protein
MLIFLKEIFKEWRKDNASLYAASLAFYILFALGPVLVMAILVAGIILGKHAVQGEIIAGTQDIFGNKLAAALETLIENAWLSSSSGIFMVISIIIFLYAASRVFTMLKEALNIIWDIKHQPKRKLRHIIKSRGLSILFVLSIGLLLILSLFFSGIFATLGIYLYKIIPIEIYIVHILNLVFSFILITFVFAMIYKFLPDIKISWKDVWIGAGVTAFLFLIGNILIGVYMREISSQSIYGAAGSVIIVLLWLYYCAQIFFLGAEFTNVYAKMYGSLSGKLRKWFKFF